MSSKFVLAFLREVLFAIGSRKLSAKQVVSKLDSSQSFSVVFLIFFFFVPSG